MDTFEVDPNKLDKGAEIWNDRINIWFNRAAVAYQMNQIEVSKDALSRRWQYQQALAELEGTEKPDPPNEPEFYFGKRGSINLNFPPAAPGAGPGDYASVPRRPRPDAGSGEVELPLPSTNSDIGS